MVLNDISSAVKERAWLRIQTELKLNPEYIKQCYQKYYAACLAMQQIPFIILDDTMDKTSLIPQKEVIERHFEWIKWIEGQKGEGTGKDRVAVIAPPAIPGSFPECFDTENKIDLTLAAAESQKVISRKRDLKAEATQAIEALTTNKKERKEEGRGTHALRKYQIRRSDIIQYYLHQHLVFLTFVIPCTDEVLRLVVKNNRSFRITHTEYAVIIDQMLDSKPSIDTPIRPVVSETAEQFTQQNFIKMYELVKSKQKQEEDAKIRREQERQEKLRRKQEEDAKIRREQERQEKLRRKREEEEELRRQQQQSESSQEETIESSEDLSTSVESSDDDDDCHHGICPLVKESKPSGIFDSEDSSECDDDDDEDDDDILIIESEQSYDPLTDIQEVNHVIRFKPRHM